MCLIPRQVLDEIGLSLPLFIKWDDAEFGLRAKEAGYPTVTFPGAAVWHVPWTDKNDAVDWQAYFHVRNRFVAALLHSPYPRGGRLVREDLNHTIAHLVSMQYSTVEIRHLALEDVLAGPHGLHALLPTGWPRSTRTAKQFTDAPARAGPRGVPGGTPREAAAQGPRGRRDPGPARPADDGRPLAAPAPAPGPEDVPGVPRGRGPRRGRAVVPPGVATTRAIVSMNDGTSAALYQRDPVKFRELMKRDRAAARAAASASGRGWRRSTATPLGDMTSPEAWEETFRPWTDGA